MKILLIFSFLFFLTSCNKNSIIKEKKFTEIELNILTKDCKKCHGLNFNKSVYGVTENLNTFNSLFLYDILLKYKWSSYDKYGFGQNMNNITSKYSNEELRAISKYIEKKNFH